MNKLFSIAVVTIMAATLSACDGELDKLPTSEEMEVSDNQLEDKTEETNEEQVQDSIEESATQEDFEKEEPKEEMSKSKNDIGRDFDSDVENGLLFIDMNGRVVDKDNNFIEAYSYIQCTADRTLLSENNVMEGYMVDEDMKIVLNEYIADAEVYTKDLESTTYMDQLRLIADPAMANVHISIEEPEDVDTPVVHLEDNGGPYYSEIIYGCWWENGVINGACPTYGDCIVAVPLGLALKSYDIGILDNFKLIDQDTCTVDSIIKQGTNYDWYGFYVPNISRKIADDGKQYFTGYLDDISVVVTGEFYAIDSGNNVFVYAKYAGMTDDNVPSFDGKYLEIVN